MKHRQGNLVCVLSVANHLEGRDFSPALIEHVCLPERSLLGAEGARDLDLFIG